MVIDLQFGSTGKGLIVGKLAETMGYDTILTAWAPNAGHTYIDSRGRKYVHTHLANGIVSPFCRRVMLGPGSLIDPDQLLAEIESCKDIINARQISIHIHPHAAIVTQKHRDIEAGPMTKIGSTKKGVGAAMIQRIERNPDDSNVAMRCKELERYVVSDHLWFRFLDMGSNFLIEGAQGFGLSMYHGFYPYTTSRDVSTWQILADVGVPRSMFTDHNLEVIGTCRTYPIRVANRYDENGEEIGYSGPGYFDQHEISFEEIGQPQELTTVTKLPRRIFTFSGSQVQSAIKYNGVTKVFLNFANYVKDESVFTDIITKIEQTGVRVEYVGYGPAYHDVKEVGYYNNELRREHLLKQWREHVTS
jgi:adenylosuccinate synthase